MIIVDVSIVTVLAVALLSLDDVIEVMVAPVPPKSQNGTVGVCVHFTLQHTKPRHLTMVIQ